MRWANRVTAMFLRLARASTRPFGALRYSDGCGLGVFSRWQYQSHAGRPAPFGGPGVHIADSYRQGIHRIIRSLWQLEVPAIAAVNGPAIGLGNDVASLCDIRIAAKAPFSVRLFKIGLIPGMVGLGCCRAKSVVARQRIAVYRQNNSAETAAEWGLVSEVVDDEGIMQTACAMADEICAQSPEALRAAKRLLRNGQARRLTR